MQYYAVRKEKCERRNKLNVLVGKIFKSRKMISNAQMLKR